MRELIGSILLLAAFGAPSLAVDGCETPPAAARMYLDAHPGWRILRLTDLIPEDQSLWSDYHKGKCPGMAEIDFDGTGRKHVALALLSRIKGQDVERIVVVRSSDHGLEQHTIYREFPAYVVIWRVGPGTAQEWDTPKKIRVRHDSLIVERLESATQQYYWANGKFRYVQTSD